MPKLVSIWCVLFFMTALTAASAEQKSLDELRARADAASPSDCVKVCMTVAKQLLAEGTKQFSDGDTASGMKSANDAVRYAENSGHSALTTRRRLKDTEIDIREIIRRLSDMKQTLDPDDRPTFDQHITRLQNLRDELLSAMFGVSNKKVEHK